uniref:Putative secreted protein n=1 Tax=Anopheles darlingi TaxID=43151 RepID=A0A2M4D832_ANODA
MTLVGPLACVCVCVWATHFTSFDLVLETAAYKKAYNEDDDHDDDKMMMCLVRCGVVCFSEFGSPQNTPTRARERQKVPRGR